MQDVYSTYPDLDYLDPKLPSCVAVQDLYSTDHDLDYLDPTLPL